MEFFTIGVYNSSADVFFGKLQTNKIDTFCDIRQRRGVRGSKYAFVNSQRLQARLADLGIAYKHTSALAPTPKIRALQKQVDTELKVQKKSRIQLTQAFETAYKDKILENFDLDAFLAELEQAGAHKIVFFCVEEHYHACHRSLVAAKISSKYALNITHL